MKCVLIKVSGFVVLKMGLPGFDQPNGVGIVGVFFKGVMAVL